MKRIVFFLLFICVFLISCTQNNKEKTSQKNQNQAEIEAAQKKGIQGKVYLVSDPILKSLAQVFVDNYTALYPTVMYELAEESSSENSKDLLLKEKPFDFFFSTQELTSKDIKNGLTSYLIAKDAILPVFNTSNPCIQHLVRWGISKEKLKELLSGNTVFFWNDIHSKCKKEPIALFLSEKDASGNTKIADLYQVKASDLNGKNLRNEKEIYDVVFSNPLALGFFSSSLVFNSNTGFKNTNMYVLPIDFNEDGLINDDEHIYDNLEAFNTAVREKKYFPELERNIYIVVHKDNDSPIVTNFLQWIYGKGQNFIHESSFIPLTKEEIAQELKKINK